MKRCWGKKSFLIFFGTLTLATAISCSILFSPSYHTVIPLKTTRSCHPYVSVIVGGQTLPLKIDLGSIHEARIEATALEHIKKKPYEETIWTNVTGNSYKHHTFILPRIEVEGLVFRHPIAVEFLAKERKDTEIYIPKSHKGKPKETVGCLGRSLLKKYNLFFDMQQAKMIATDKLENLAKEGYSITSFVPVPFLLDPKGILVNVKTDLGKLKLLLDTGCTVTIIRDHLNRYNGTNQEKEFGMPIMTTREFTLGKTDFGSQTLYFYKITEKLQDIDGLLGMDFIANHLLYIDFKKKLLYIAKDDLSNP